MFVEPDGSSAQLEGPVRALPAEHDWAHAWRGAPVLRRRVVGVARLIPFRSLSSVAFRIRALQTLKLLFLKKCCGKQALVHVLALFPSH